MALSDLSSSVTMLLIASIVGVSILCWAVKPIFSAFLLIPYRVGQGEVHRLLTAGWIHADLGHLVLNVFTLYLFSPRVLAVLGELRFLLLYVSAVVIAFLPTTLRFLRSHKYSSLGASGAVAAVLFSGILLYPEQQIAPFFVFKMPAYVFALLYLAYSAWHSYSQSDNINHDAHFYGAAYGILATFVLEPGKAQRGLQTILNQF